MKRFIIILVVLHCYFSSAAQNKEGVNISELIKISESRNFKQFTSLTTRLGYLVLDSSKNERGATNYITKEVKLKGNTLGCWTDSKLKIEGITFSTYHRELYDDLKNQIIRLKFKSQGTHKGTFPNQIESEDFEKGALLISTATIESAWGIQYEFTFLNW